MTISSHRLQELSEGVLAAFDAKRPDFVNLLTSFFESANAKPDEGMWVLIKGAEKDGDRELIEIVAERCIEGYNPNEVQELYYGPQA